MTKRTKGFEKAEQCAECGVIDSIFVPDEVKEAFHSKFGFDKRFEEGKQVTFKTENFNFTVQFNGFTKCDKCDPKF